MDIRIEKTESAIKAAFLELRTRKPPEKIKVKDLCDAAKINKSTFYAHYQDIYALSDALEEETICQILDSISGVRVKDYWDKPDLLTRELFAAFLQNKQITDVLFSGRGQSHFADRNEEGLRTRIDREDPSYSGDIMRHVLLSFCVQGAYYAFVHNSATVELDQLVDTLGRVSKAAQGAREETKQ
jgi:AcrR family transcriptional regulator